ncbi:MAG: ABC transporter ATP-binding protein [Anaerolineae bacterium]|nr:ABC transporter ATP-binding protein/permease [Candidatus Roseilinea sp.]MDW8450123.1 ABC transporter ATP-binding protein [Anaerolineae bacterium]
MHLPPRPHFSLLSRYLRPQRVRMILLAALLFGSIGLQLLAPQVLRHFIDAAQSTALLDTLAGAALWFIALGIAGNLTTGLAAYVGEDVAWTATNRLRADLAAHCLRLDMTFHKDHTAGEMIERIDGDVTALSNFFSQFVVRVLGTFALLIGVLVLMFVEDWRIGLAMTAYAGLALLVLRWAKDRAVPYFKAARQAAADLSSFWEERLSGLEDIRSSGATDYVMRLMYALMRALFQKNLRAALMGRILFASAIVLFSLGNAIAIGVGGWLLGLGALTLGGVYLIFDYTGLLSSNLRIITEQLDDLQRASAGIERVTELMQRRSRIEDAPDAIALAPANTPPALEFRAVSFAYDAAGGDDAFALKDVSFTLPAGRVLGLLGRTGSGKTTLSRLLFRFYDPTEGVILLDGMDIRRMKLADLRRRIAIVTQDVQLFQASVRDNLTFFDRRIPDTRIVETLNDLGLGDWLASLPDGLDTELQSGSGSLSAGEAQLLAFARAFLQSPGLVILDEASSRLDPATERRVERAVDELLRGRTAIIIAHRLATVQRADDILILENGRLREFGPRRALMARPDSRFSQLLRIGLQAGGVLSEVTA